MRKNGKEEEMFLLQEMISVQNSKYNMQGNQQYGTESEHSFLHTTFAVLAHP
jgi:hypothetical protein